MSPHNSYDEAAYLSGPIREADPLWMATIAALFGLPTVDPADADILEIGCGDAGNLLSIAAINPGSRAVGFDPAKVAIQRGQEVVDRVGLKNVTLHHDPAGIEGAASADYVIAHGVLSWVHDEPRRQVVETAARAARDGGLVYFSYRTFPHAFHELGAIQMAKFAIQVETERAAERGETLTWEDEVRVARERVRFAAETGTPLELHGAAMRAINEKWSKIPDWSVYHDDLSDPMQPFRITEIVELAAEFGLRYVGELLPQDLWQARLPEELRDQIRELGGPDAARRRQMADDLTDAGFHSSLFVKSDAPPALEPELGGRPFHVRQYVRATENGEMRADRVSAPVAQVIREHQPGVVLSTAIAEELSRDQDFVDEKLLRMYSLELARLSSHAPPVVASPGEYPRTWPLVLDQLKQGARSVITRFHTSLVLEYTAYRTILMLADGTRDRAALARDVPAAAAEAGMSHVDEYMAALDVALDHAAQDGLLVDPDAA